MRPPFSPNQQGFQPPARPGSGQGGFNAGGPVPPSTGVRPPFQQGMRPPMPQDRSGSPQTIRPLQQPSQLPPQSPVAQVASPPANLAPTPSFSSSSLPDGGPQSPTSSHMSHAEHQRRKRMYPQQITQAYMDQPSPAQSYDQQQQYPATTDTTSVGAGASSQYFAPASQQQSGYQGSPAPGYAQQQQQAAQTQGQQPYQSSVAGMTNQFSNMAFGGAQVRKS